MARIRDLMGTGNSAGSAYAIAGTAGNIVAAANNAQAGATLLSYETNYVTTGATTNSVVLPTAAQGAQPGDLCYVFNASSTSANCFPGGSEKANASTSAVTVAQNKMAVFKRMPYGGTTDWAYLITA